MKTVYQNLQEMLEMAVALKRPDREIAHLRAEIARFDPPQTFPTQAARDDFDCRR